MKPAGSLFQFMPQTVNDEALSWARSHLDEMFMRICQVTRLNF